MSRDAARAKAAESGLAAARCQEHMTVSNDEASCARGPDRHRSIIGPLLVNNVRLGWSWAIASSRSRFGSNASAHASIREAIEIRCSRASARAAVIDSMVWKPSSASRSSPDSKRRWLMISCGMPVSRSSAASRRSGRYAAATPPRSTTSQSTAPSVTVRRSRCAARGRGRASDRTCVPPPAYGQPRRNPSVRGTEARRRCRHRFRPP